MNTGESAPRELLLVDKDYLLVKQPGKGGWTYLVITEIPDEKRAKFGWIRVKGAIDGYALENYRLMPMGKGKLFLPVKSEIRKVIRKQAGDVVHLTLYADDVPMEVPEEIVLCLEDDQAAYQAFSKITEEEKKAFLDWIYTAKTDETKARRIANMLDLLVAGKKLR